MPILNKNRYYFLNSDKIEPRTETVIHRIVPFDDAHYWYIEFFDDKSLIFLKEVIPTDVLDSIQKGKIKLCLSNTHEAFNFVVSSLYYHVIKELKIPEENVLLISESANISVEVTKQANFNNKKEIKTIWTRVFETSIKESIEDKLQTLEIKPYNKKFVNLNRRARSHRPMFVALAEAFNLRELGYISLADSDTNSLDWTKMYNTLLDISGESSELNSVLSNNKEKIVNIPHMYLDTTDLVTNRVNFDVTTDTYYQNSYFSVVSETYFYDTGRYGIFLSEKIFKPIAKCHPFIAVSLPGTLSVLKSLGYKTFSPLIDESYDIELDDHNRMLKIIKEVERLSNLSDYDLKYFLKHVKKICDHNFNILKNQSIFFKRLN